MQTDSKAQLNLCEDGLENVLSELFGQFEIAFRAAQFEVQFTTASTKFICRTDMPFYHDMATRSLASKGQGGGDQCRMIVAQSGTLGLPHLNWSEDYFHEREVEARLSATRYRLHYMADIGFWQIYDQQTARGIQLLRGPQGYPDWDPGSPLRNFLHWHLGFSGLSLVHAGTLAVDGIGLMLAGPGKSGKSGTVLAGIAHGLSTVGDDYVLADIRHGVKAMPLFNTVKLDSDGIRRLSLWKNALIPKTVNWQGKHQFTLDAIAGGAQVQQIEIRALCLPHITGEASTKFRGASAKETFLMLAPSAVSQIPGDRDRSFAFCAELARILPCYHVDLSSDPVEVATAIRAFINSELT